MKAYITLLSSIDYLDGVLVLNETLKRVESKYPLYCMLAKNIGSDVKAILEQYGISYLQLENTVHEGFVSSNSERHDWDYSNWNYTFDKILVWELTQFDKLVFVDSDMIVVNNIDHLFEHQPFSASLAGVLFPTNHDIKILNSGLMVIEPNLDVANKMKQIAKRLIPEMQEKNLPLGDQDIINEYFNDWFEHKQLILDDGYNLYAHYLQSYMRHFGYSINNGGSKRIYIIHFVGRQKPWMISGMWNFAKMCVHMFPNVYYMKACWNYIRILNKIKS